MMAIISIIIYVYAAVYHRIDGLEEKMNRR